MQLDIFPGETEPEPEPEKDAKEREIMEKKPTLLAKVLGPEFSCQLTEWVVRIVALTVLVIENADILLLY